MTKEEARLSVMGAISMALKDPILQQGFEIICKENAELKEKVGKYQIGMFDEIEKRDKQLTKAKELLRKFIETSNPIYFEEDRQKVKVEAEQFLKEKN